MFIIIFSALNMTRCSQLAMLKGVPPLGYPSHHPLVIKKDFSFQFKKFWEEGECFNHYNRIFTVYLS